MWRRSKAAECDTSSTYASAASRSRTPASNAGNLVASSLTSLNARAANVQLYAHDTISSLRRSCSTAGNHCCRALSSCNKTAMFWLFSSVAASPQRWRAASQGVLPCKAPNTCTKFSMVLLFANNADSSFCWESFRTTWVCLFAPLQEVRPCQRHWRPNPCRIGLLAKYPGSSQA